MTRLDLLRYYEAVLVGIKDMDVDDRCEPFNDQRAISSGGCMGSEHISEIFLWFWGRGRPEGEVSPEAELIGGKWPEFIMEGKGPESDLKVKL